MVTSGDADGFVGGVIGIMLLIRPTMSSVQTPQHTVSLAVTW